MTDTAIRPTATPPAQPHNVCGGNGVADELNLPAMRARLAQLHGSSNSAQRALVASEILSSNPSHVMDVLACTTSPEFNRVLTSVFGGEAEHMREAIGSAVSHMFRKEMLEDVTTRMHDTAAQLRTLSSEPQLSRWAADVARNSPDALARVEALANFRVDTQVILRAAHSGSAAALRDALRDGARQATQIIETSARGIENGQYDLDFEGAIYDNFPGSITHVAYAHGAPHSDALRANHDASALGALIADDRAARESSARFHRGVEGVCTIVGGLVGSFGLSAAAGFALNVARSALALNTSVRAAYAHANDVQAAAGLHLNSQEAVDEALIEATAERDTALAAPALGLIPGGAAHGLGHTVAHTVEHVIAHEGIGVALPYAERSLRP